MKASVGDTLHVRSRTVEETAHHGEIIEVRGVEGQPPYLVRFDDGHERLVYPGPDSTVERPQALH